MKTTLTIRVDEHVKTHIENLALEESLSSSEYVRGLIEQHLIDEGLIEEEINHDVIDYGFAYIEVDPWYTSIKEQLPKLTLWLFAIRYSYDYCTLDFLKAMKVFLENAVKSDIISSQLRFEFVKVLNNINLIILENGNLNNLQFIFSDNMYSLDYNLLYTEVSNLIDNNYAK